MKKNNYSWVSNRYICSHIMRLCALDGTFSRGETDDNCILSLFSTEKKLASLNTADAIFIIYIGHLFYFKCTQYYMRL